MAVERTISDFAVGNRVVVISGEKKIPGTVAKILKSRDMLKILTEKGNIREVSPDDVQMRRGRPPGAKNVAKSENANSEKPAKIGGAKIGGKADAKAPVKIAAKAPRVETRKGDDMVAIMDALNQGVNLMQKAINMLRKRIAN